MLFSITLLQRLTNCYHNISDFICLNKRSLTILQLTTRFHILNDCVTSPKTILAKTCNIHFYRPTSTSLLNATSPFLTWEQPSNKFQWQPISHQVCYAIWCMQWAHNYNRISTSLTQSHLDRLLLRHKHKQWATQNFNSMEGNTYKIWEEAALMFSQTTCLVCQSIWTERRRYDRFQTWGDYNTNVIDCHYLWHARLRLQLQINKITIISIKITLKVIMITIAITFVLKHSQKENKTYLRGFREV